VPASHSALLDYDDATSTLALVHAASERRWFAVFTVPQNEKSAVRHLEMRDVESFLPTYETLRIWRNRQRKKCVLPLFPSYLFVRINRCERSKVLQTPGVLHIIGNGRHSVPLEDAQVEFLRSGFKGRNLEPYTELVVGEKVRIETGVMQGVEGILVRRSNQSRFVLSINLINQYAAVEVDAEALKPIPVQI
jgi:transcription antitermination factor NusG